MLKVFAPLDIKLKSSLVNTFYHNQFLPSVSTNSRKSFCQQAFLWVAMNNQNLSPILHYYEYFYVYE